MDFAINLIWTLILVGIIIFFHELGHFIAAKKVGIKVERFSIGFGPKMIGFKKGETEYQISWIPILGGYVKMAGENPSEEPNSEGEEEEGQFLAAPVSHRAIVAASGPGMNLVFAVVVVALAYMFGLPAQLGTTIGYVEPDSPASIAGIQRGDQLLSINGYKVRNWDDVRENVAINPEKQINLTLMRDGSEKTIQVIPDRAQSYTFSIDLKIREELDSGNVPESIRQRLIDSDIPLSPDAMVSTEKPDEKWLINDKEAKYLVLKDNKRFSVYRGTEGDPSQLLAIFKLDFPEELDEGVISEELKQRFKDNGISLSESALVSRDEVPDKWLIVDKGRTYHVNKESGRLDVYKETEFGMIGVSPVIKPVIGNVESDSSSYEAGFRSGDVIVAVNGKEVKHIIELVDGLQDFSSESAVLTVERNGDRIDLTIPMDFSESGELPVLQGLAFGEIIHLGPIAAFMKALPETVRLGGKIFQFLKRMFTREVSMKYVAGPVGIVQLAVKVVETGVAQTLWFAGFLSVNLGIVNLLPLFITDGGVLVFLFIEKLRGRRLSRKKQIIIQQIGVGFIALLFLLVTYNDFIRLIKDI
jgi:regulator of sigma E protease